MTNAKPAWVALTALLALAARADDERPPVKFQIQLDSVDDLSDMLGQFKGVAGVADCQVSGATFTFVAKTDEKIKLSDIKKALAGRRNSRGGPLSIKYDALKLEGKITVHFDTLQNLEKIEGALRSVKSVQTAEQSSNGYDCSIKSPDGAILTEVAKAVARETGATWGTTIEPVALVDEVIWYGLPKYEEPAKPDASAPASSESKPAAMPQLKPAAPAPAPTPVAQPAPQPQPKTQPPPRKKR